MGIGLILPYTHYCVFSFVVLVSFCGILCVGLLLDVSLSLSLSLSL